ncbi:mannosyl transferase [Durotheca rogersii]|uniref:mannosyl transferase n=1 Tax=Durotheca rogersii TaxID=419775 RepID=UPI00221FA330|nr:mannosyl transferase [Durotheca rogersii]KAI5862614.1 mannosyl transferase [Durotheca rogersii]
MNWVNDQFYKWVAGLYKRFNASFAKGLAETFTKSNEWRYKMTPEFEDGRLEGVLATTGVALLLAAVIVTFIVYGERLSTKAARLTSPSKPVLEKATFSSEKRQVREWGKWIPSDYSMPKPDPYPNWSIVDTKPLPYRPFRYGPKYNITMGLRSLKPTDWIELDNHYPRYHADKARRIQERGEKCCRTAPEAYPAAVELLEELTNYLPARYPTLYRRTPLGLDNLWSGERFDITTRPLPEDPMQMCARLVQDDLAIMIEKTDGEYYLMAGAVLLAGFWRLSDKYMMRLSDVHTSGKVPEYEERLEKGMMNLFRRLKPEEMVARNNYFVQVDDNLAWSRSIGPEDSPSMDSPSSTSWNTAEKNRAVEHHFFRSERQTLRRLPRTGAIVFTIRTYFHPITEIAQEDYVPGRLASAVRSWGDDVSRYKGREMFGDVLLEYLDQKHKEQVERGLDLSREDELRSFPF